MKDSRETAGAGKAAELGVGDGAFDATACLQNACPAAFLEARGLGLKTLGGYAYKGVDIMLSAGQIYAVRGHNGSGKTALLLSCAGRMAFSEGRLRVGAAQLPHARNAVQKSVGLALFKGLNDLQESLKVAYAVGAEFELYGRKPEKTAVSAYLRQWQLRDCANVLVKDLTAEQSLQLGIALACVGKPQMIVVDDIEDQLTKAQSEQLMEALVALAHGQGTTVMVGCVERDLAAMADGVCYLEKEGA
ncbi:MAG: ATP-binding cassette domain-containing protein [Raoultibacter sp.]